MSIKIGNVFASAALRVYRHAARLGVADSNEQRQMEVNLGMNKDESSNLDPDKRFGWFEPTCQMVLHCLGDVEMLVALSPTQIRQMSEHLAACADCADVYEAYEDVDAFIASLAHDPPSTLVRERIDEWNAAQRQPAEVGEDHEQEEVTSDGDAELVGAAAHVGYMITTAAPTIMSRRARGSTPESAVRAPRLLISGKRGRPPRYCRLATSEERPETITLVQGPENVLRAIIQLLSQVMDRSAPVTGGITFTWLLDTLLLADDHPLWKDWWRVIRTALDLGWNVQHLVRPTKSVDKVSQFTENMRSFLGATGMYQPFVLSASSLWRAPSVEADPLEVENDFVLISDVGGLQLLAPDGKHVTGCRLIPPGDELAATEFALKRGIAQAHPVIAGVYPSPSTEYLRSIYEIEQHPGKRHAVVNGLSETLVPGWIHEQRARALIADGGAHESIDVIETALVLEKERQQAMLRNLAAYDHIDVCPLGAIDQLVTAGQYQANDDWSSRGARPLNPAQRRAVLESLINLLETQPHYQLWLLQDPGAEDDITEFVVKEGYMAMTEFWLADLCSERTRVDLAISEPTIVESLHSAEYWSQLSVHAVREKASVVAMLKKRLSAIPM